MKLIVDRLTYVTLTFLLIPTVVSMFCARPLLAEPLGFHLTGDIPAFMSYEVWWDIELRDGTIFKHGDAILGGGGSSTPPTSAAATLAAHINSVSGRTVATVVGQTVKIIDEFGLVSLDDGTTRNYVDLVTVAATGAFSFTPDPNNHGIGALLEASNFTVTNPSGVSASFDAATGTTGQQMATFLAASMSGIGYMARSSGDTVIFSTSAVGTTAFLPGGNGFSYVLASVPEPATILLGGIPLLALILGRRALRDS